jgi:hypothetical protein
MNGPKASAFDRGSGLKRQSPIGRMRKVKTFYAIANTEPMYRFDKNDLDPLRVQMGVGTNRKSPRSSRVALLRNWGRVAPTNNLAFTENIFRLNIKLGVKHSLLREVLNPMEK